MHVQRNIFQKCLPVCALVFVCCCRQANLESELLRLKKESREKQNIIDEKEEEMYELESRIEKQVFLSAECCEQDRWINIGILAVVAAWNNGQVFAELWWIDAVSGGTVVPPVSLNSFGNWTSPSDSSNYHWKCLFVSWAAAPCVWTLMVLTRNLSYLLTVEQL